MGARAKDIELRPIHSRYGNSFVRRHHYSGKVVPNSKIHIGVFLGGRLHGVLQYGPSLDKSKMLGLVTGTGWQNFLELNRMAFDDELPKNSESRAISVSLRMIYKANPHIKWVVSFADGTLCGDGTIYRAAGFLLTQIKKNNGTYLMPDGTTTNRLTSSAHRTTQQGGASGVQWIKDQGGTLVKGYQLRYIKFLDPAWRERLAVPAIPYSEIEAQGAKMYKGKRQ